MSLFLSVMIWTYSPLKKFFVNFWYINLYVNEYQLQYLHRNDPRNQNDVILF